VEASTDPIKEPAMATIHLHQTTTATPEQFLAGFTDFGPGRCVLRKALASTVKAIEARNYQGQAQS
jgi:hypothetical protein